LLLAAGQLLEGRDAPQVLAACPRLVGALQAAGVSARRWAGPTSPRGLGQLLGALRAMPEVIHAHDSRAHGAIAATARGAADRLVVHRRIDDVPRDRASTRWKYRRGRFVCVSGAVAAVLEAAGVERDRLHVVRSAVQAPVEPPSRPPVRRPLQLLAYGALVEHKGHADLLDALALAGSTPRLTLAGEGPLRGALTARARALELGDRVRIVDPPETHEALLGASDLFVQPSRTEGLGTAVLDASAHGVPVLATEAGGLPEAVGEGGWLVPPGDPPALAAQLDHLDGLAARDPREFARRGSIGRDRVSREHSVGGMVRGVAAVYDRVRERAHI